MKAISNKDGSTSQATNLLRLVESFEDAEHFFLVTNLMPGGDLLTYCIRQEQQPLSESHTKKIIRQIAHGV